MNKCMDMPMDSKQNAGWLNDDWKKTMQFARILSVFCDHYGGVREEHLIRVQVL